MMLLHVILVALTVFYIWETVKAVIGLPHYVHTLLVTAACWGAWMLPQYLLLIGASASVVGILHTFLGSSGEPTFVLSWPSRFGRTARVKDEQRKFYIPTL